MISPIVFRKLSLKLYRLPAALSCLAVAAMLLPASAAEVRAAQAAKPPSPLDNLRAFASDRPRPCPPGTAAGPQPPNGWRAEPAQCVWRGLLQVQRWHAPARPAVTCTGLPARYWAWMRTRFGQPMRAQSLAWDMTWRANAVRAPGAAQSRVAVIVRNPDNSWTATEWHWTPSARIPTRAWQQGRWELLQRAAAALQPSAAPAAAPEVAMVRLAWEDALRGRAAETEGSLWRWPGEGACVAIDTVGLSDAQMQMPYQNSESRLEQRAAMQLLMARRYPGADWLAPFSLLPQAPEAPGGAKYSALWRVDNLVLGQLWIPRKDDQAIVRVRMSATVPPRLSEAARAPHVFRTARAINGELAALAAAWDGRHER